MDDETVGTVFRDAVMLALLGFVAMVVLMIPHLNPPTALEDARAPGNLVVEITWADGLRSDIDLWVQGPGDRPVGYSRKSGRLFNLLRDDLGASGDLTALNYEFAVSRGIPAGDYTINLHLFSAAGEAMPIPVSVTVSLHRENARPVLIARKTASLDAAGQELTVFRFTLNERGRILPGSLHDLQRSLRSRRAAP